MTQNTETVKLTTEEERDLPRCREEELFKLTGKQIRARYEKTLRFFMDDPYIVEIITQRRADSYDDDPAVSFLEVNRLALMRERLRELVENSDWLSSPFTVYQVLAHTGYINGFVERGHTREDLALVESVGELNRMTAGEAMFADAKWELRKHYDRVQYLIHGLDASGQRVPRANRWGYQQDIKESWFRNWRKRNDIDYLES